MEKDLTESRYVIVTEDEDIIGPFSSREDAQRHAEALCHPATARITNESKYVNFAESDETCKLKAQVLLMFEEELISFYGKKMY